jgi:phospholipid/cholesterol/gamma-HCH transport system substrate-binding protein
VNGPQHLLAPVDITMKITTKFDYAMKNDCQSSLNTAGVLGEVFVDIDCRAAKSRRLQAGDVLPTQEVPQLQDVVRASQSTLQNVNILIQRVDDIISYIQNGQGTIGKTIYDPALYNRADKTLTELQQVAEQVNSPNGSIGKLINGDELYNKANAAVDNLNKLIDEVNSGQGTVGKFLKDPSLYDNANKTIAQANDLMAGINQGKGTLGMLTKDQAFARKLDDTITRLNAISERMDKGEGSVGKLLKDPSLYNNADQMLIETRNLLAAIRKDPKTYLTIHLKLF